MVRKLLKSLGLLAVVALTLVACAWLRSHSEIAVTALATFSGMAAWVANAIAKGIAEDATLALWDLKLAPKEAAAQIDMDRGQASRQLTGIQRLDYAAWAEIDGFDAAFAARRAKRLGTHTVHENGLVSEALALLTSLLDGNRKGVAA